jgi:hypothetical protein
VVGKTDEQQIGKFDGKLLVILLSRLAILARLPSRDPVQGLDINPFTSSPLALRLAAVGPSPADVRLHL